MDGSPLDPAVVAELAHRLKGSARGIGARRLGDAAAAIEAAARAGDIDRAAAASRGLDEAFRTARAALEREIRQA